MLRDDTPPADTTRPAPGRRLSALGLCAVTLALLALRGPARAGDGPAPAPAATSKPSPFDVSHVSDAMSGVVAFRPAAVFAKPGMADHARALRTRCEASLAAGLKVDPSTPGFPRVGPEDLEWVVTGFDVGRPGAPPEGAEGSASHALVLGGLTVRATHPVDWLAVFRAWGLAFEEVREGGRVFHKVVGPLRSLFGPQDGCVYLPDDRTFVFNSLSEARAAARRGPGDRFGLTPAEHAAVGLFVLANRDDGLTRKLEAGAGKGDEAVLSRLRRVDRWSFRIDDADTVALRGSAECRSPESAKGLAAEALALAARGGQLGDDPSAVKEGWRRELILKVRSALAGLKATAEGARVEASTGDFGTFAWFAPFLVAELAGEAAPQTRPAEGAARATPEGADPVKTRR